MPVSERTAVRLWGISFIVERELSLIHISMCIRDSQWGVWTSRFSMTCVCGGGGLLGLWKALTERLVVVLLVLVLPGVPWWGDGRGTRGGVGSRGGGRLLG